MASDTYYSGKIGYVRIVYGKGAYQNKIIEDEDDSFGFAIGFKDFGSEEEDKTPKPIDDEVHKSAFDELKPVIEKENDSIPDLEEYGYGFWARFLTAYPKRMY